MLLAKGDTLENLVKLQRAKWVKAQDALHKEVKRLKAEGTLDLTDPHIKELALEAEKNMRNWNNPEKRVIRQ